MNRFLPLLLCALMLPLQAGASEPGSETGNAREQLLHRIDTLQQAAQGLEHLIDPGDFDKLRDAIGMLDDVQLGLIAQQMSDVNIPEPLPNAIAFPDPNIVPSCEGISPTAGYVLFSVAAILNEILALLKWSCLQVAAGENGASACVASSIASAVGNMAFLETSICLNTQRSAYQTADFATQANVADHLNQYVDAKVSSLASESSLDDLQAGISQELEDLDALSNSVSADVSDLSADFRDISNNVALLISSTLNISSVSEDVRFKALITQAEAEEIDDLAADTQQRLETVRTHTQQIGASAQTLASLIDGLNDVAGTKIERELDAAVGRAMADPDYNIVRYKLPASMDGELERSREVLVRAILAFDSIGADTSKSLQFLTMGDDQFNAGRYLAAYDHFATAYQMLLVQASSSPGKGE